MSKLCNTTPRESTRTVSDSGPITVFDPVNRRPYKLDLPVLDDTEGLKNLLGRQKSSSKRVFLCKNYQLGLCRAGERCLSIHANPEVIAALRKEHPMTDEDKASEVIFTAKDPESGIEFRVPKDRTDRSKGQEAALVGTVLMCTDHDKRGCPLGEDCPLLHVKASYMRHVRILWRVPCCKECSGSKVGFPLLKGEEWETFLVGGRPDPMPRSHLAVTKGLRELCRTGSEENGSLHVPINRVCRPHQRIACKWGHECSNVHICRKRITLGKENEADTDRQSMPESIDLSKAVPLTTSSLSPVPVTSCVPLLPMTTSPSCVALQSPLQSVVSLMGMPVACQLPQYTVIAPVFPMPIQTFTMAPPFSQPFLTQ